MGAAASRAALLALSCAACASVAVDGRTFADTSWRVTAVNGQPTPRTGDYRIDFRAGTIGGRFGCNQFGGRYAVEGDTLVAAEIASTLMGCPEPAASFEGAGLRVLGQPMRWTWTAGTKLTLSNGSGSISLERVP